jgi:hypothetical protein
MNSSRIRWVVICAAGIVLAGCDDGPSADAPAPTRAVAGTSKPASLVPPNMVAAVASSRNARVVSVHFSLNGTPTVGKALPVDIAIVPHQPVSSLNVHFEVRDGLAIAAGNVLENQADPRPEALLKHQLVLLPSKEGVFMVVAVVETQSSEGTVSRIFSIPVIVSPAGGAAPAPVPAAAPVSEPAAQD